MQGFYNVIWIHFIDCFNYFTVQIKLLKLFTLLQKCVYSVSNMSFTLCPSVKVSAEELEIVTPYGDDW